MDIESTEKYLNKIMNQFNKHTKQKENTMLKEDTKQVLKFVNAKVDPMQMWGIAREAAVDAVDTYMEGQTNSSGEKRSRIAKTVSKSGKEITVIDKKLPLLGESEFEAGEIRDDIVYLYI